jgi:hypothetical protein
LTATKDFEILEEVVQNQFSLMRVTLAQLVVDILQAHADGIVFRELNAGTKIDA